MHGTFSAWASWLHNQTGGGVTPRFLVPGDFKLPFLRVAFGVTQEFMATWEPWTRDVILHRICSLFRSGIGEFSVTPLSWLDHSLVAIDILCCHSHHRDGTIQSEHPREQAILTGSRRILELFHGLTAAWNEGVVEALDWITTMWLLSTHRTHHFSKWKDWCQFSKEGQTWKPRTSKMRLHFKVIITKSYKS